MSTATTENPKPRTLAELKRLRESYMKSLDETKQHISSLNRVAMWITEHVGSMGFFVIIFTWTACWLGWNIFGPKEMRFDPYPAFVLWLFISNMIQLFLMPLIMIGQNVQSKHADLRAEIDFKINAQAELETETILTHLEYQNTMIIKILEDLERKA